MCAVCVHAFVNVAYTLHILNQSVTIIINLGSQSFLNRREKIDTTRMIARAARMIARVRHKKFSL